MLVFVLSFIFVHSFTCVDCHFVLQMNESANDNQKKDVSDLELPVFCISSRDAQKIESESSDINAATVMHCCMHWGDAMRRCIPKPAFIEVRDDIPGNHLSLCSKSCIVHAAERASRDGKPSAFKFIEDTGLPALRAHVAATAQEGRSALLAGLAGGVSHFVVSTGKALLNQVS